MLHIMNNAYWEPLDFEIPPLGGRYKSWRRLVDTFRDSPDDVCTWASSQRVLGPTYPVQARSVVILMTKAEGGGGA